MERKLIKQGDNALTITLPAKWLQEHNLKAGNTISLTEENAQIIISTSRKSKIHEIEVDITKLDRSASFQKIISCYIEGYDIITINHISPEHIADINKELTGMIIEKQTQTYSILRNLIVVPEENINVILQRIRFMLLEQGQLLVKITQQQANIEELRSYEKLTDQNILYCLRYICKYERSKDAYRLFSLCLTFDLIGDKLTEIGRYIGKDKILASQILTALEEYITLTGKGDLNHLNTTIRTFRNKIGTKTFVEGLTYSLAETMYNFIGYLMEKRT